MISVLDKTISAAKAVPKQEIGFPSLSANLFLGFASKTFSKLYIVDCSCQEGREPRRLREVSYEGYSGSCPPFGHFDRDRFKGPQWPVRYQRGYPEARPGSRRRAGLCGEPVGASLA